MTDGIERAALIALLRTGRRPWSDYVERVQSASSALAILEAEHGLLAGEQLDGALAQMERWRDRGWHLTTVLDRDYPQHLRALADRPPFLFIDGSLTPPDANSVAVIGAREATERGLHAAAAIARELVRAGYTVVSGLAAGIDTQVHRATLDADGRTLAVIGTGLSRSYPPQNVALQREISVQGAVLSQFWPDAPPQKRNFPKRNGVMSGVSLATVVVEASETSGARVQIRLARAQGRPVLLVDALLKQSWAREVAARPGTYVVRSPSEVSHILGRLTGAGALTT